MGLWTRKSFGHLQKESSEGHHFKKVLTPFSLVMLGIGCIIGAGLFSITGIAAAENAGPAVMLSFIIAAIGCAFAGLCYSELATMIPVSGSAYTYTYASMGELLAWIIGWNLILEYAIGAATVSISWSAYFVSLLTDWNIYLPTEYLASPWQPVRLQDGSMVHGFINLPAVLIVGIITAILIRGIHESTLVNTIFVILKVSIVAIFIVLGYFYIQPANHQPFLPENTGAFGEYGWSGVFRAAGVVFFAYIGFDSVSTAAQETHNPSKAIPIGILGSLVICTILYILFAYVMTGLVPYKSLNVAAPVAVAIDRTPFWWLNWLIKIGILAGFTSVILVLLLGQSRIFYAMARDGLLPHVFSEIHPTRRTPWRCNLILMAFVMLFSGFAPLSMVGHMTSIGTLFAFALVCGGVLVLRYKHPELDRPFRTPFVPLVPILGIGVCAIMMASLGLENWLRLLVWLAIGVLFYAFYGRHHSKISQHSM
jgi:APA family basic amino acid/polyamine antiporter